MMVIQQNDKVLVIYKGERATINFNTTSSIPNSWFRKICHEGLVAEDNVDFSKAMENNSTILTNGETYRISVKTYLQDDVPVILINYDRI